MLILYKGTVNAIICPMNDLRDSNERYKNLNIGRASFMLIAAITFIVFLAVLKIAATLLVPLVIALFLTLVLHPLMAIPSTSRFRVHRNISIFVATALIMGGLFFIGFLFFESGRSVLSMYPRYEYRLTEIYLWLAGVFDLPYDEQLGFFQNLLSQLGVRNFIRDVSISFSNSFLFFLRDTLMVVLFMVFLLIEAAFFKTKLETAFEGKMAVQIKNMGSDMMKRIAGYISIKFLVSLVNGIVVGVLLWLVGVEFALVWGILQFVLNFIPGFGSVAIGFIVSLFSLVQFWPDPYPIILTVLIMIGVNVLIGFVLEPKIIGDNIGISPIVILLSVVLWGFIWGFVGMVLAVPLTVVLKIICENVPVLEPISIILGSRRAVLNKKEEYEKTKTEADPAGNEQT